jgi:hypothetical protein
MSINRKKARRVRQRKQRQHKLRVEKLILTRIERALMPTVTITVGPAFIPPNSVQERIRGIVAQYTREQIGAKV